MSKCWWGRVAGVVMAVAAAAAADKPLVPQSPRPADQAQKDFRLPAGLRIELVASEPQIESPVAMTFDESGRLWVVEMRDYPNGPAAGQPPQGRIRRLEDRDGDGRYETASTFADGLLFANGLLPWKGGLIVTAAPHILYLKDGDGDGKADIRQVLFEGFAAENPQLRVSHPILGLDNWVYVANGLRGGKVTRPGADSPPLNLSGMDFRFDPHGGRAETVTGMGQFGNSFDKWGNRFVCTNRNHLIPIVLPSRYVQRNPYLVPPEPVRDDQRPGGAARVHPISSNFTTSSQHAGSFSAACGVTIYRGRLLPADYHDCAFTCEPTGNLVHQEVVSFDGAGFYARPAFEDREFLASPDDWFRPVSLAHGPDGALYVVDMYRAVIEHPQFMTPEYRARADLEAGRDKGRIWRIVPESHRSQPIRLDLGRASTAELVERLDDPDGWMRMTAHRLLLERRDRQAVAPLTRLCASPRTSPAPVHAAYLLDDLQALTPELVHALSLNRNPRVREHAVFLSERWLADTGFLQNRVRELSTDFDPRVRFQVALSLGEWDDDRIVAPLARIALEGSEDRWTRMAVATAVPRRAAALVAALVERPERGLTTRDTPGRQALLFELAALVGARQEPAEIAAVLESVGRLPQADAVRWQLTAVTGLAEGVGRRGGQLGTLLARLPESRQPAARLAEQWLARAAELAVDSRRDAAQRLEAVRLLAHAPWSVAGPALVKLLDDPEPQVRLGAVRSLSAQPRPEVAAVLMKGWRSYTPPVRREVIEAMLRQPERIHRLLDEVQAGRIKPADIDLLRTRQLVNHARADIRDRARPLLDGNLPADRQAVLLKYQQALKQKGDPRAGLAVFQKNCAACHRILGVGTDVGPSITDTLGKTPEQLLADILNPNQAIDNNFINYVIATRSGKVLTGIIQAETPSSITLVRADNQRDSILKSDIEEIQSTGASLMPEGLEKQIGVQEMADLLAFLKQWRYLEEAKGTR